MGNEQSGPRENNERMRVQQLEARLRNASRSADYSGCKPTPDLGTGNQISFDSSKQSFEELWEKSTASVSFPPDNSPSAASSPEALLTIGAIPNETSIFNPNLNNPSRPIAPAQTTTAVPLASPAEPARTTASDLTASVSTVAPSKERINLTASKMDAIGDNGVTNSPPPASNPKALLPIRSIPIIPGSYDLSDTPLSPITVSESPIFGEKPAIYSPAARVTLGSHFPNKANVSSTNLKPQIIPAASTVSATPLVFSAEPAHPASDLTESVSTAISSTSGSNDAVNKMGTFGDCDGGDLPKLALMSSDSEDSDFESTVSIEVRAQQFKSVPDPASCDSNIYTHKHDLENDQCCDVHETQMAVCVCRHCNRLLCQVCQTSKAWCDATSSEDHDCLSIRHGATQLRKELEKSVEERLQHVETFHDNLSKKEAAQSALDRNVSDVSDAVCAEYDSIISVLQAEKDFRLAELKAFKVRSSKQLNSSTSSVQEKLPEYCSSTEKGKELAECLRGIAFEGLSHSGACATLRDGIEVLKDFATLPPSIGDTVKPVGHFEYSPQQEIGKTELHSRLDALTGTLTLFTSRGKFLRAWGEKDEKPDQTEKQDPCHTCSQRAEDDPRSQKEEAILRVDKATSTDLRRQKNKGIQTVTCITQEKGTATDSPRSRGAARVPTTDVKILRSEKKYPSGAKQVRTVGDHLLPFNDVGPPFDKEFDHHVDNSGMNVVYDAVFPRYKDGPCFTAGPGGICVSMSPTHSLCLFAGWFGGMCASTDGNWLYATRGIKKCVDVFSVDSFGTLIWRYKFTVPGASCLQGICYRPEDGSLVIVDNKASKLIIMEESYENESWQHVEDVKFDKDGRNMFKNPLYVASAGMNRLYVTDGNGLVAISINPRETIWVADLNRVWTVSRNFDRVFVTHGGPAAPEDRDTPTRQRVSVISAAVEHSYGRSRVIRTFDGPCRKAVKVCPKGDGSVQMMLVSSSK